MENVSENKRRRGRPAKLTEREYEKFAQLRAMTPRGKQNYIYACRAMSLLTADVERFAYLLKPVTRTTILAELGRIKHPSLMISVANGICASRMKAAKAVGLARRVRGNATPDVFKLAGKIRRTIQDYRDRYPNLSPADVATALHIVSSE